MPAKAMAGGRSTFPRLYLFRCMRNPLLPCALAYWRTVQSAERGISPSMPRWAMDAVVYQIFPLGFFGAPHANDQRSSPVPRLAQLRRYYSYLQSLGVNCVYFGPLFESMSHGSAPPPPLLSAPSFARPALPMPSASARP